MNLHALTSSALTEFSVAAAEPEWLLQRRLTAHQRWSEQQWPDSRTDEFWRSTPFSQRFNIERIIVGADGVASDSATPASVVDGLDDEAAIVRIVDGVVTEITVPSSLSDLGVTVSTLADAAVNFGDLVKTHLGSLTTSNADSTGGDEDRTIGASDAAWTAGVFV